MFESPLFNHLGSVEKRVIMRTIVGIEMCLEIGVVMSV